MIGLDRLKDGATLIRTAWTTALYMTQHIKSHLSWTRKRERRGYLVEIHVRRFAI